LFGVGVVSDIALIYRDACMAELSAVKPGNVHMFADGHGMVVQDFIKSADASAQVIAKPNLSVGERILSAVKATWEAVGCNTNLGIVLLAAPMVQASYSDSGFNKKTLQDVLNNLTVDDAVKAYEAISIAKPAGLGEMQQHDVHQAPQITLLEAMKAAADRDLIAQQYANGYQEVFNLGVTTYQQYLAKWDRPAWAVTTTYLAFMASFEDSHIARKYGKEIAQAIQQEAKKHFQSFTSQENPKLYQATLLAWDADLKKRIINPGTSADLTVATIFANHLLLG
jgi:triphosphoribosyl-dephospho-CoA synthase